MAFSARFDQHNLADLSMIDEVEEDLDALLDDLLSDESPSTQEPKVDDEIEKKMAELQSLMNNRSCSSGGNIQTTKLRAANAFLKNMQSQIVVDKENQESENIMLKSTLRQRYSEVKTAQKKHAIRSVARAVCDAESVDLAFVVDCTSSMSSYLDAVRNQIQEVVRRLKASNGNLSLRLAFVAYRGVQNDSKIIDTFQFSDSVQEFEGFVGSIKCWGGDGLLANMAGGIQRANALDWQQPSRTVCIIADMPCHGNLFHASNLYERWTIQDWWGVYPEGTPGIDILHELQKLSKNVGKGTMTLVFGRIQNTTDIMIGRFRQCGLTVNQADVSDTDKVTSLLTSGIRSSIFKTMTLSQDKMRSISLKSMSTGSMSLDETYSSTRVRPRQYSVVESQEHDWKSRPLEKVIVFSTKPINSIDDLKKPVAFGKVQWTGSSYMAMKRLEHPFAEGNSRVAFLAQVSKNAKSLSLPQSQVVAKAFKYVGGSLNQRMRYIREMEASTVAEFLAKLYNESQYRPAHCATIKYLRARVLEHTDAACDDSDKCTRYVIESPLVEGQFTKFSNNAGIWSEVDETLLRFSVFTYEITRGYIMVTDLQGVRHKNAFELTDPVVLCSNIMRFGEANLGPDFMAKCLDSTKALMAENGWS